MNRSLTLSIVLTVFVVIWVLSGSGLQATASSEHTKVLDKSAEPKLVSLKVKVQVSVAELVDDSIFLKGQVEANREVEIKAELSGKVTLLEVEKGARVLAGDHIMALDLSDLNARLEKAKAELVLSELNRESGRKLKQKNLLSSHQLKEYETKVLSAKADVKQIEVEISKTNITAPFESVMNGFHVELGDYVSHGDPLATLIDDTHVKISADVPQQHISKLRLGQEVEAELIDGRKISGKITYISSVAKSGTRTFRIEAIAANLENLKYFGLSARVTVKLGQISAHKLSPALLDLNNLGELQVKGVSVENRVISRNVDIVRSERDGLWLTGLPDDFTVITTGQGFVSGGDIVNPVFETVISDKDVAPSSSEG